EPVVTVGSPPWPSALPAAVTASPTRTLDEFPVVTVARPDAPCSWMTATSCVASVPTTVALYVRPLDGTSTLMFEAPLTTWLLVSTSHDAVSAIPVPAPAPPNELFVVTFTTPAVWLVVAFEPGDSFDDPP